jgi:hypothetical protein
MLRYLPIALAVFASICVGSLFTGELVNLLIFSATISGTVMLALLIRFALGNRLYDRIDKENH